MSKIKKVFLVLGIAVLFLIVLGGILASRSTRTQSGANKGFGLAPSVAGRPMMAGTGAANSKEESAMMAVSKDSTSGSEAALQATATSDRLIIKNGSLTMVVKDVRASAAAIIKYAEGKGGFVVNSNISKEGLAPQAELTVRIPATEFDTGLGEVKQMGEVKSETVNGQDVTEEYVDLQAQVKNLRASESQFLEIMKRAVKIEDVLAVQRELTNIRGQIEGIEGRIKYLEQSAKLSSLTVYLSTDPNVLPALDQENQWKPWAEVKAAARSLVEVGKVLVGIVIWLVIFIPLWLLIILLVWLVRKWRRRKEKI